MQPFVFTQDDLMQPVYCIQCRAHIPRAVSNANKGVCGSCLSAPTPQVSPLSLQAVIPPQQVAMQQAIATNFGLGRCPICGSSQVNEYANTVENDSKRTWGSVSLIFILIGAVTICFGGFVFITLGIIFFIVSLCTPDQKTLSYGRSCGGCGHRWQI